MMKEYLSAPLPFVGQKRMFAKEFKKVLDQIDGANVFVDLFGGSGLLSHITKRHFPEALVVYNDFDNYKKRLAHIGQTNELLHRLRDILSPVPRLKIIPPEIKSICLPRRNITPVSWITSPSQRLCFSP